MIRNRNNSSKFFNKICKTCAENFLRNGPTGFTCHYIRGRRTYYNWTSKGFMVLSLHTAQPPYMYFIITQTCALEVYCLSLFPSNETRALHVLAYCSGKARMGVKYRSWLNRSCRCRHKSIRNYLTKDSSQVKFLLTARVIWLTFNSKHWIQSDIVWCRATW